MISVKRISVKVARYNTTKPHREEVLFDYWANKLKQTHFQLLLNMTGLS